MMRNTERVVVLRVGRGRFPVEVLRQPVDRGMPGNDTHHEVRIETGMVWESPDGFQVRSVGGIEPTHVNDRLVVEVQRFVSLRESAEVAS